MRQAIDASPSWSAFDGFRVVIVAPQFGRRLHRIGQREDIAQQILLAVNRGLLSEVDSMLGEVGFRYTVSPYP